MNSSSSSTWPIGVFASVDAGLGVAWEVIAELGVPTIHLHAPARGRRDAAAAKSFSQQLRRWRVDCTVVFGGFEGESYQSIPSVAETVGLVPEATRPQRFAEMCEISDFARNLECGAVGLHLGFIPENATTPGYQQGYQEIVDVTRRLCDHCQRNDQSLHLETGQESADGLLSFLAEVDRENLRANFDPANMILYGTGDPIEALRKLRSHLGSVHCKDAVWSPDPGKSWGREVPLGTGDVNVERFLQTLHEIGYRGPLTIEREIPAEPERQRTEIGRAVELLRQIRMQLLGPDLTDG